MTITEDLRALRVDAVRLLTELDRLIAASSEPASSGVDITGLQRTKAIEWVLEETGETMRPVEIWKVLQNHDRSDPKMEVQVTTFDLAERNRIEKVGRGQYRAWQRDEDDSQAPMLLHEAIKKVLQDEGNLHPKDIAAAINARKLYRRSDGQPLPAGQVRARVNNYPDLFDKEGPLVTLR